MRITGLGNKQVEQQDVHSGIDVRNSWWKDTWLVFLHTPTSMHPRVYKATKKEAGIDAGLDILETVRQGSHLLRLFKPCKLLHRSMGRVLTINAGSIRPPHWLIVMGRVITTCCAYHSYNGALRITEHTFWKCDRSQETTQHYEAGMQQHIKEVAAKGKNRGQFLKDLFKNICDRQCGICRGDPRVIKFAYNINVPNRHSAARGPQHILSGDDMLHIVNVGGYLLLQDILRWLLQAWCFERA